MPNYTAHGITTHTRLSPIHRFFMYRVGYLLVDINDPSSLNKYVGFAWNRPWLFSLHHDTYLTSGRDSLPQKVRQIMAKHAPSVSYSRVYLLSSPRFFNMGFNPVSFFYCLDDHDTIVSIIAEVHNTCNEKHLYLLHDPVVNGDTLRFTQQKVFYVSPFLKKDGAYDFSFSNNLRAITVTINYNEKDIIMFKATLRLTSSSLNQISWLKMGYRLVVTALTTLPRILLQASILKLWHRLPHYKNTGPMDSLSSPRRSSSIIQRIMRSLFLRHMSSICQGSITFCVSDEDTPVVGDTRSPNRSTVVVHRPKFFQRCVLNGEDGLVDSFIRGEWSSPHLSDVLSVLLTNEDRLRVSNPLTYIQSMRDRIQHRSRHNSIQSAKKNIYEHYDLGNDFFNLFLDKHRLYSSAIFKHRTQSLDDAQLNKVDQILSSSQVQPNHHLLEIGSGWGTLAIRAAQTIGCRVTTVTISREQYKFVKEEINRCHLDGKVDVKRMDYRDLTGSYDRIVSVEMLEAVGHDYLLTYFKKCYSLLTPTGKAIYQAITINESRYDAYLKKPDFGKKP